jgi:hypothetical protein
MGSQTQHQTLPMQPLQNPALFPLQINLTCKAPFHACAQQSLSLTNHHRNISKTRRSTPPPTNAPRQRRFIHPRNTVLELLSAFEMSTDLPFLEAQLDALTNTIWWSLDQKFGRVARPSNPPTVLSRVQQIWDSVFYRLSIALIVPYALYYSEISFAGVVVERPLRVVCWLWTVCILGPWIYQIFVYSLFLDPLRRLPGPKVYLTLYLIDDRDTGCLVWAWVFLMKMYISPITDLLSLLSRFFVHLFRPVTLFSRQDPQLIHSWDSSNNPTPAPSPRSPIPLDSSHISPLAVVESFPLPLLP